MTEPTEFELTLTHRDKAVLENVVGWLMDRGCFKFGWERTFLSCDEEYTLSIEGTWADNLYEIAMLLKDFSGVH